MSTIDEPTKKRLAAAKFDRELVVRDRHLTEVGVLFKHVQT